MGIPGSTTNITNFFERYLENYALHDTYLVIDGDSITRQLYTWHTKCDSIFGGDYDKYAKCVSNFFDKLLMCNITPLVLINGGCKDKKLGTNLSRTKEKIEIASHMQYTFSSQKETKFLPLFLKEVFKDVMNEKGIKYAQCIFEADNTIAAIARILNCPILSYNSDFYIYGSLYIPFNTWENDVVCNPTGRSYMKYCKIYNVEKLFQDYNGLNQSLLPLAAILLLKNDYVKQHTFRNFFRHLKLSRARRKRLNKRQCRIDATFNWLRRLTLNEAVTKILNRLRRRQHVLSIMETMINDYINPSALDVLYILGVPTENFSKAKLQNASRTYKFEGDIYNSTYIDEITNETGPSDDVDQIDDQEIASILAENKLSSYECRINELPKWFIDEIKLGRYPSYFIDIIVRQIYICPTQIENYLFPSSINASLKIIRVIYQVLKFEDETKLEMKTEVVKNIVYDLYTHRMQYTQYIKEDKICLHNLQYITRDKKTIKRFSLDDKNDVISELKHKLSLNYLRKLSKYDRKIILQETLQFRYWMCTKIPPNWMLYIATMKYWIDQTQTPPLKLNCHIYSLLFALLFDIIDRKIGFYRNLHKFHHKFDELVEKIQNARMNYQPEYSDKTTLMNALNEVNTDDCWIIASFFISNFEAHLQKEFYDINIVHHFAEFQNCLRHSMNLNALLDYPCEQTKVANLFNGTLLYNLCSNFKMRDNVEKYINRVLKNSPSLLRLFNMLLSSVRCLFPETLQEEEDIEEGRSNIRNWNIYKKLKMRNAMRDAKKKRKEKDL